MPSCQPLLENRESRKRNSSVALSASQREAVELKYGKVHQKKQATKVHELPAYVHTYTPNLPFSPTLQCYQ